MKLKYFPKTYSFFLVVVGVVSILFLIIDFTYSKFFFIGKKINIEHNILHHHLLQHNSQEVSKDEGCCF